MISLVNTVAHPQRTVLTLSLSFIVALTGCVHREWGMNTVSDPAGLTRVRVDCREVVTRVPSGLYSAGYDGWGDIIDPQAVEHLQGVGVTYLRFAVDLGLVSGDCLGDYRLDYTTPRDLGLGFVSRIRTALAHGWTPILAVTLHSGAFSDSLPSWFHGSQDDWFAYNLDGSKAADGRGDQLQEMTRVLRGLVSELKHRSLSGLHWETAYELGAEKPLPEIHHAVARGIRDADADAVLMGPATWPGWTVEERFVRPYLSTYGPELLDVVTVHWYSTNEHALWDAGYDPNSDIVTMADTLYLTYLMESVPRYSTWTRSLRALLDDPELNPEGKPIGIAYTEYDANAHSPYRRNPVNPRWPAYDAAADCYVNTNYFGGVWSAALLTDMATNGAADMIAKFNTRQYYGLIENNPENDGFFRQPVWFAWRLLREAGGLTPGAALARVQVEGPCDDAATHYGDAVGSPWIQACAVTADDALRLILVNRSFEDREVGLRVSGVPAPDRRLHADRYLYSRDRLAPFIGRPEGSSREGAFQDAPDDRLNERTLKPLDRVRLQVEDGTLCLTDLTCPAISITVLVVRP